MSDVLEITDPVNKSPNRTADSPPKSPETDDWESLFDENGECLDPKFIDELTAAVGKVTIEKPKSDYKVGAFYLFYYFILFKKKKWFSQLYHSKQAILNAEEFPHVLEISNFPAEFKTQDLMMLFSAYKESGFDIKWVDDTHALAVFSSSKVGKRNDGLNLNVFVVSFNPFFSF